MCGNCFTNYKYNIQIGDEDWPELLYPPHLPNLNIFHIRDSKSCQDSHLMNSAVFITYLKVQIFFVTLPFKLNLQFFTT